MPKQGPMKWPLPDVVHPPSTICFQINVPNERHYLGAFYGAMFLLSKPYAWGDDPDHTALEVGAVWRDIFDRLIAGNCIIPTPPLPGILEDFDMPLRIDCDCNVWITCCDGTEKQIFTAEQVQQAIDGQPSTGAEQPSAGGGCATYHGVMGAAAPWYVPTVVNTGDTIEILRASGVTNDGGNIAWRAFDGGLFFAGSNTGLTTTEGGDPLPAVPHLKLIANIDGTFYDIYPGAFTVPSVSPNSQVTLQVNDDPLVGNAGELTFDVKVCNNQEGNWTSVLDFTTSPYASFVTPSFAPWTVGVGFEGDLNGTIPYFCQIDINLDSFSLDSMTMEYGVTSVGGTTQEVLFVVNGGGYGSPASPGTGFPLTYNVAAAVGGVTSIIPVLSSGSTGGTDKITKLTIHGHGPKPSQLP